MAAIAVRVWKDSGPALNVHAGIYVMTVRVANLSTIHAVAVGAASIVPKSP